MKDSGAQPAAVKRRTEEDLRVERRIRAHLRQQMESREIDMTELAKRIGYDNGAMSRVLRGERGIGLGLVLRIVNGLHITASRLLEEDPAAEFFGQDDAPPNGRNHGGSKG